MTAPRTTATFLSDTQPRFAAGARPSQENHSVPNNLDALLARAKAIRTDIIKMTTEAGSGDRKSVV